MKFIFSPASSFFLLRRPKYSAEHHSHKNSKSMFFLQCKKPGFITKQLIVEMPHLTVS